jgi:HSP20 family protein
MLNTFFANDVRQTLDQFRRSVDQMFENFYGQPQPGNSSSSGERSWTFNPVLESAWNDRFLTLRVILPGVAEKDVNVSVQHNELIIQGERRMPEGFEKNAFTQLAYGKFHAAVSLPQGLDLDHVQCTLNQGILNIHVPVSEASRPKQIPIQTGEGHKAEAQKVIAA